MGAAFTSCTKGEDLFDSGAYEANQRSEYATNFEKKYGTIKPDQSWDFATMTPISYLPSTSAGTRAGGTRAGAALQTTSTMSVGKDVVDWMHDNMKAGTNNSQLGSPFISKTNQTSFTIVPFYQGKASYFWELWMNVGGEDIHIWTKNQNVVYKTSANGDWQTVDDNGIPANAIQIQAPSYTFEADPNQNMYFYLKVWTGGKDAHDSGATHTRISSLDKMMLALDDLEKSVNSITVPQGDELTVIGCEDKSTNGSDNDFEDLVFLMYGPPVIHIEEKEIRETKRYMMEDLGTTDDFDFNDVVIDLSIVYRKKLTFNEANMLINEEEISGSRHQEAIVRAAGGTINFTVKIGTNTITTWTKVPTYAATDMVNTGWGAPINYNAELAKFNIINDDWDPAANNIVVEVEDKGATGGVKTITFPKQGTAPMMIAVDPDQYLWMSERTSVPSSWWY